MNNIKSYKLFLENSNPKEMGEVEWRGWKEQTIKQIRRELYSITMNPTISTLEVFLEHNYPELVKYVDEIWEMF